MTSRSTIILGALFGASSLLFSPPILAQDTQPSALELMLAPGPRTEALAQRVGRWAVTMTFRPTPEAEPVIDDDIIADRTMIGGIYMQEIMRPSDGSATPNFRRIAYLSWNRLNDRYDHVSLDTRYPRIMDYTNFGVDGSNEITFYIERFVDPGFGPELEGRGMRMRQVVSFDGPDTETVRQYWTPPGGGEWLVVEYRYRRGG
jgi:hypothetical protein